MFLWILSNAIPRESIFVILGTVKTVSSYTCVIRFTVLSYSYVDFFPTLHLLSYFHFAFRHPVYSETILLPEMLSDYRQVSLYSNKFVEMKIHINNREIINIKLGIRKPCAQCNCVILPRCVHPLLS